MRLYGLFSFNKFSGGDTSGTPATDRWVVPSLTRPAALCLAPANDPDVESSTHYDIVCLRASSNLLS